MNNRIILQVIFWTVLTGITTIVSFNVMNGWLVVVGAGINMVFFITAFYANVLYLFPRYYNSTKQGKYIMASILFVAALTMLMMLTEIAVIAPHIELPKHIRYPWIVLMVRNFFWLSLMVMLGTAYQIQRNLRLHLKRSKEIEEEKLETELKLLRSQINPHFLFNALNNIYSLSYMKSDSAPESILKLSSMLRYVIEDCVTERVPLTSEIEYIENFISFQQMKSPDILNVEFNYPGNMKIPKVAPMLFIPFIENSFKYSKIDDFQNACIRIDIVVNENGIIFTCKNSVPPIGRVKSGAGTGISNVKQRLHILYPEQHFIEIVEDNNSYTVKLELYNK